MKTTIQSLENAILTDETRRVAWHMGVMLPLNDLEIIELTTGGTVDILDVLSRTGELHLSGDSYAVNDAGERIFNSNCNTILELDIPRPRTSKQGTTLTCWHLDMMIYHWTPLLPDVVQGSPSHIDENLIMSALIDAEYVVLSSLANQESNVSLESQGDFWQVLKIKAIRNGQPDETTRQRGTFDVVGYADADSLRANQSKTLISTFDEALANQCHDEAMSDYLVVTTYRPDGSIAR